MDARAALAGSVIAILRADVGRTDEQLQRMTGASPADLSSAIGGLYRRGQVDRCGRYVVLSASARPLCQQCGSPAPLHWPL